MFSISICMSGIVWSLLFRTKESAEKAHALMLVALAPPNAGNSLGGTDDFGQFFTAKADAVDGILFEDMSQSKLAHQERLLHQARTQASAQKAAQTDPQLRAASQPSGLAVAGPFNGMPR